MKPALPTSFIPADSTAEAVRAFFEATAALHRIDPWKVLDPSAWAIELASEALGLPEAVAVLVANDDEEQRGIGVFTSMAAFEAWQDNQAEDGSLPPHWMVTFQRGRDLAPALRKEAAEHQWDVAGPDAFPVLLVMPDEATIRGADARVLDQAEAVARAVVELVADHAAMSAALDDGEAFSRAMTVAAHAGPRDVRLTVTVEDDEAMSTTEVMITLADLVDGEDGPDPDTRRALEEVLLETFAMSPEGRALPDLRWTQPFLERCATDLGVTVPILDAVDVGTILLDGFAASSGAPASAAPGIVEELRAFFAFLGRASKWPNAEPCRTILGPAMVEELAGALASGSPYDVPRSALLTSADRGVDMHSKRGLDLWMSALGAGMAPPDEAPRSEPRRGGQPLTAKAKQKKKDKRKAEKKARKKRR